MKVFISYSQHDIEYLAKLKSFCHNLFQDEIIEEWDDTKLILGEDWGLKIDKKLDSADMIIFLVSQEMIVTNFIQQVEIKRAIERAARNELQIVPIVVKPCDWEHTQLQKYNTLFKGIPLSENGGMDKNENVWLYIANRLRDYYDNEFDPN